MGERINGFHYERGKNSAVVYDKVRGKLPTGVVEVLCTGLKVYGIELANGVWKRGIVIGEEIHAIRGVDGKPDLDHSIHVPITKEEYYESLVGLIKNEIVATPVEEQERYMDDCGRTVVIKGTKKKEARVLYPFIESFTFDESDGSRTVIQTTQKPHKIIREMWLDESIIARTGPSGEEYYLTNFCYIELDDIGNPLTYKINFQIPLKKETHELDELQARLQTALDRMGGRKK
jgi:hypothetical protein